MKMMEMTERELAGLACIHEGGDYSVFLQAESPWDRAVVIKLPRTDPVSPEQAARIANEYCLTADLQLPGVRRAVAQFAVEGRAALALEYIEGATLSEVLARESRSLAENLELAVAIAAIIEDMHRQGVVHHNLAACHILLSTDRKRVWLIGFGGASRTVGKGVQPKSAGLSASILAYVSPEQTGRIGRLVDARADLYSFGALLYEILTGKPPFESGDPTELIHCHLALKPMPPCEVNSTLPGVVSAIVMRLLAKNPDERYQSAYGVKSDLENCLSQLHQCGRIEAFELGQVDYSSLFRPPEGLYGREDECRELRDAVSKVGTGVGSAMAVSGLAGVGKSALVEEIRHFAVQQGVYFCKGEYEASQRHLPYAGLMQALGESIDLILTESAGELGQWKARLLEAVGANGSLLIEMLPRLELIIGPQTTVLESGPAEAQHLFQHLLKHFVLALARRERPLVLFLDNLQWADPASLHLLHLLLPGIAAQPILFLGAYRQDEVGAEHPLTALIGGGSLRQMVLENLSVEAAGRLIADALKTDLPLALPLARRVVEKTGGNPLFVLQFMQLILESGLLRFDTDNRRWIWDGDNIRQLEIAGSVAALMAEKITALPQEIRALLSIAACIGNRFDIGTLAQVVETPLSRLARQLTLAVEAGLIRFAAPPASADIGQSKAPAGDETHFAFSHDRVRQAAYALLPRKKRRLTHLRIGRQLLAQTPENLVEEHIFEIADQLNEGFQYLTGEADRRQLVALNLVAGRKARRTAAYQTAIRYLSMGIGLLPADHWESCSELALNLYMESVEAEYMSTNFDRASVLSNEALEHARDPLSRIRLYELQILFFTAQDQNVLAIQTGLNALAELDAALPAASADGLALDTEQQRELSAVAGNIEALAELAEMTDPRHLARMRLLMHMTVPVQRTNPALLKSIVARMVLLSVAHGNSPMAGFAYGWHGALSCGRVDGIDTGYRFGQLSLAILRKFHSPELEARVLFLINACIRHWKAHARESVSPLQKVFRHSVETGDLEFMCQGAIHYCNHLFFTGAPLETVYDRQTEHLEAIERSRLSFHVRIARVWAQTVANLRGDSAEPTRLSGERFDEMKLPSEWIEKHDALFVFSVLCGRMILRTLFEDFAGAVADGRLAGRYAEAARGFLSQSSHTFYFALALLAQHEAADDAGRAECLRLAEPLVEQLRGWAASAPMNFAHKLALVEAEQARIAGSNGQAMACFNKAIRLARVNRYPQDEALAFEREALFYDSLGRDDFAGLSRRKAIEAYRSWGALRKAEEMERRFRRRAGQTATPLDTAAIVKASHTLSQEIRLAQLLERLMNIVIENAGAEKGVLIQQSGDGLVIQAQSGLGNRRVETMQGIAAETSGEVAPSVINYVARTLDQVVLGDACHDPTFGADNYIAEQRTRSLLCLPIVYQGKFSGLLYLENNLATDVFTADRLELLKALASQAAISMENAGLYADLESNLAALRESEQKFRAILDQTFQFIGLLSTDGVILQANQAALQLVGASEAEVLGKPFWETHWWVHSAELQQRLRSAIKQAAQGQLVRFEANHPGADGEIHYVDFSVKPVSDAQGNVVLLIPEGHDITERKHAEEELRRYKDRLEETVEQRTSELLLARDAAEAANKAKSVFLSNMSHELRTPLNSILGFSSLVSRDPELPARQRENLDIINRSGEHLLTLINDVLEIAKIEAGRLQLETAPFNVVSMVRGVADMMQLRAEEKGLHLALEIRSDVPIYLDSDEARLRQILINLVGNAVKFTEQGGITIRFGTHTNEHLHLLIEVEDSGPGISAEDQQRLFKPFVQLTDSGEQKGTGLGLTITKQFVELMGGVVTLESHVGKGSLFRVELPAAPTEAADVAKPKTKTHREIVGLAPDQPHYRILIAEDQRENRLLLRQLMTDVGLDAQLAENGEQCVNLFETWHPDLIWMDRRMPVMDGEEATRRIRQLPGGERIKIVAVSASAFTEEQQKMLDAGVDDLVSKPYRFDEIYDCLSRQLGVCYLYEQAAEENETPVELTPAMLAVLPQALRINLRNALESLETEAITDVIRQTGTYDSKLEQVLGLTARNYDYPAILKALDGVKR